jgi:hypothetical protein
MELLCPNCQKKLTVPDQYAGQLMKCPLCNGTFTTPSLPPAPSAAFTASPAPVPPAPAPASPPPPAHGNHANIPGVDVELLGTPRTSTPERTEVEPFAMSPLPPSPLPPSPPPLSPPPLAPEPTIVGDYRHRWTVQVSPRVLPWVAAGALVLVFLLTFFPWVGFHPGGIAVASQNAWQAAFGSTTADADVGKLLVRGSKEGKEFTEPGANGLLIVFLLVLLAALVVGVGAAATEVTTTPLPPAVERLRPWRWVLAAGITLLAFIFLFFQVLAGFSLTNRVGAQVNATRAEERGTVSTPTDRAKIDAEAGMLSQSLRYTNALWCAFWLTLLAVVCAVLAHVLGQRKAWPLPRMDLQW